MPHNNTNFEYIGKDDEDIYRPAEDTYLLTKAIKKYNGKILLEIGVGSGYVTIELLNNPFVIGTDISIKALRETQIKLKSFDCNNIELVNCDGASPFRLGIFNVIVFNPPYLPSEEIIDITTDGGKEGVEVIEKLIQQSIDLVSNFGSIIFVLSTLSNYKKIVKILEYEGFKVKKRDSCKLFFEEIFILEALKIC